MPPAVLAQGPAKPGDILNYQGPDREKRLIERAKQEGALTIYTSLAPTEAQPLVEAFEKKYGIKVELWRAISERVVQRAVSEAKAGRHTADVIATNGPEMEVTGPREDPDDRISRRTPPTCLPPSIPKHRLWMPDRLQIFVVGYNTNLVKREELPKSLTGFTDPKWKGKLGIEAGDAEWMATLVKKWGEAQGMAFFRKLSEMRPEVRKGHVLLAQLVAAGEIPVGLTTYSGNAETLKRKGAPIDWVAIDAVARPQGHRHHAQRAASRRGPALRGFCPVRGGRPETVRVHGAAAGQHQDQIQPHQLQHDLSRSGRGDRRGGEVAQALGGAVPQKVGMKDEG